MKPLVVLIVTFVISLLVIRLVEGAFSFGLPARIAMSVMLLFTAIAHFAFTKGMVMMVPSFIPFKTAFVYFTGFIEVAAAIGLLVPGLTVITGWLLVVFFIVMLPANIYAALHGVDYQKGNHEGPGVQYLWFRVPLQLLFIGWTWFCIQNA